MTNSKTTLTREQAQNRFAQACDRARGAEKLATLARETLENPPRGVTADGVAHWRDGYVTADARAFGAFLLDRHADRLALFEKAGRILGEKSAETPLRVVGEVARAIAREPSAPRAFLAAIGADETLGMTIVAERFESTVRERRYGNGSGRERVIKLNEAV